MREVRMTFGEHLEELRRRILWALLWLALAVTISFIYGRSLLKWTMGPHEFAIRLAMRERAASILKKKGEELVALTLEGSPASAGEAGPDAAGGGHVTEWSGLFAEDFFRLRLAGKLRGRVREWAAKVKLPAFAGPEGAQTLSALELFTDEISGALSEAISGENRAVGASSIPERFEVLERDLRQTLERIGSNAVKQMIGLSLSTEAVVGPLAEFNQFMAARRDEVLKAPDAIEPSATRPELIRRLETLHDEMRVQVRTLGQEEAKPPIAISYLESFMTYFKVALVFGLFFSTPMLLYEMWKFVGAGLYPHEQHYVLIFLPFSVALFFGGAMFGYFSVIPIALSFLAGWGADLVEMSFTLSNYVGLFFTLTVLLGLVFQTPLVMIFFGKIGLVSAAGFRKARKWALMGSVFFSAVVTPPDPLSWSLVAIPMILLYELGILLVSFSERKKAKGQGGKPPGPQVPTHSPQGASA
jgi:Tat protein translocase TatC